MRAPYKDLFQYVLTSDSGLRGNNAVRDAPELVYIGRWVESEDHRRLPEEVP